MVVVGTIKMGTCDTSVYLHLRDIFSTINETTTFSVSFLDDDSMRDQFKNNLNLLYHTYNNPKEQDKKLLTPIHDTRTFELVNKQQINQWKNYIEKKKCPIKYYKNKCCLRKTLCSNSGYRGLKKLKKEIKYLKRRKL